MMTFTRPMMNRKMPETSVPTTVPTDANVL